MGLQLATNDDIPAVIEMATAFFESSPYAQYGVSEDAVRATVETTMSKPLTEATTILWVKDGVPVGVLAGMVGMSIFNYKTYAAELMWWVKPEYRSYKVAVSMLSAFEYWANQLGCQYTQLVCVDPSVEKLYLRHGYKLVEQQFIKQCEG